MILLFIMNCCFAVSPPLLHAALSYVYPATLVALRMSIGGAALMIAALCAGQLKAIQQYNWPLLCLNGLFSSFLLCMAEAYGLLGMSPTKATLIWALFPLTTALASRIFEGIVLAREQLLGILLGLIGIVCVIMPVQITASTQAASSWHTLLFDLLMVIAVCSASVAYICTRRLALHKHPVLLLNGVSMIVGGGLSALCSYIIHGSQALTGTTDRIFWVYLSAVIIVVNGMALTLQTELVTRYSPTLLALSSFMTPLLGLLISVGICGDSWHRSYSCAVVCILWGLYKAYSYEISHSPSDQKEHPSC